MAKTKAKVTKARAKNPYWQQDLSKFATVTLEPNGKKFDLLIQVGANLPGRGPQIGPQIGRHGVIAASFTVAADGSVEFDSYED